MKKNIFSKKRDSAALIIALLIVAFVGMIVVAAGRDIVQNNLATSRYTDALNANELAWAAVEDGIMRVRSADRVGSDVHNFFTPYWPLFNYVTGFTSGVPHSSFTENITSKDLYKRVMRRNVSAVQRAGGFNADGALIGLGLNYETPLDQSCRPLKGDTQDVHFDACANQGTTPAGRDWTSSDSYYDWRVSGSDDDLGASFTPPGGSATPNRTVNLDNQPYPNSNLIMESGYYQVSKSEPQVTDAGGNKFVDKIIDLSNYRGNTKPGSGYAAQSNQIIRLKYDIKNFTAGTDQIMINTFVKYAFYNSDPANTTINQNLSGCALPAGFLIPGTDPEYFFARANTIDNSSGWIDIPIPQPCGNRDFEGNVEYLGIRFRLYPYGASSGGCGSSSCNVSFGLTTANDSSASPQFWPRDDSFIGTGVYKIKATGVYNNVRKTIELWVAKNMYSLAQDPTGQGKYFHCVNVPPPADADIQNCSLRYYRQINY